MGGLGDWDRGIGGLGLIRSKEYLAKIFPVPARN
jgi:hypothetical protein